MANRIYRDVTIKIIEELKTALATGTKPVWVQPWSRINLAIPRNAATGRKYSGVNVVLIWLATRAADWKAPYFLTFKQALELGGHVRKGEHGTKIYFVKDLAFTEDGQDEPQVDERAVRHVRMLKTFTVFNVQQCDNLPAHIAAPPAPA